MACALQEVELTKVASDDYVHFGDLIQLVHVETGHVVASDVSDKDPRPNEEACSATAAPEVRSPCCRNTFVVLKYTPGKNQALEPEYEGSALHYGQKFRLALHPGALGEPIDSNGGSKPLCLYSKPFSMQYSAKYTKGKSIVGLTQRTTAETLWQLLTPDPAQRSISEGLEVMSGSPVLLVHCMTQKVLVVLPQKYPTEFGLELELSCEVGAPKHAFALIGGSRVASLPPGVSGEEEASSSRLVSLVEELKGKEGAMDSFVVRLLQWSSKDNALPADELLLIARLVGSTLPESEIASIATAFSYKPGSIDSGKLVQAVRKLATA